MTYSINELLAQKESLSKDFCLSNEKRINEIKLKIEQNISFQIKLAIEDTRIISNPRFLDALQLIDRATKINITCIELVQNLNFIEPTILTRNILELCTTAIAISKDDSKYKDFLTNKRFKSSKTIGVAELYIPEIGIIWGELSNFLIHINSSIHGAEKTLSEDSKFIQTKYSSTALETGIPENLVEPLLDHLELIADLIQYSIAIIFFQKETYKGIEGYLISPNGFLFGDTAEKKFKRLYKKIYLNS